MVGETEDPALVEDLRARRGHPGRGDYPNENKAIVSFRIDGVRPLVGDEEGDSP